MADGVRPPLKAMTNRVRIAIAFSGDHLGGVMRDRIRVFPHFDLHGASRAGVCHPPAGVTRSTSRGPQVPGS